MKQLRNNFILLIVFAISGCGLGIKTAITNTYPPLDSLQDIVVLDVWQVAPANAVEVGVVSIYDNMTMRCDSAIVYSAAKREARKAGGNILKVTEHLYPNLASSCHRIKAKILKLDSLKMNSFKDSTATQLVEKPTIVKPKFKPDSRVALNAGVSWQTAKISSGLSEFEKDYYTELKSGFHYGGEYNYFFNQQTGIGIVLNVFHASNSTYASAQTSGGTVVSGTISDDINIVYVGPNITWRVLSPTQMNAFLFGFSIGYMHYNNQAQFLESYELSGSTLGFTYDLSYDFSIAKDIALGLGFSWKIGVLSSMDVSQNGSTRTVKFEDDQRLGLGHLDLSLGLRFK